MPAFEQQSYTIISELDDDLQEYPTFDALEHTRSSFSRMSIKNKSTHCPIKADDDQEIKLVVKEIDEKYEKSYEEIQKLIEAGKVDKLKLDQCKIYLKKHGLRMAGKKDTLIQRIKEHIDISTKANDEAAADDDDIEVEPEVEFLVLQLDEKDQKSYEAIQNLIEAGKVDKLKLDQCKIYLKKHGLRMAGNKSTLIQRIKEHIDILDGGGERKYPASSFVLNCKGDACTGDIVMFEQNVYEMFNIASRSATGPPCGTRTVAGRIVKESYGASKQQHTFTIEVLWCKGDKPLPPLHPLLIKGRNLYRIKTMRQKWEDEEERRKILSEKHARGDVARSNREARVMSKAKRQSKHGNDKRGPILQHPPQRGRYECQNQLKENHFHVNKIEPILHPAPHVQSQQGGNEYKNLQKDNQFHDNDKRGPIMQCPPQVELSQGWQGMENQQKNNHFHGNEKRRPIMQHPPQVKLQQGWQAMKNQQKNNHFHGNENRGPILQHPPPVKLQHVHNKYNQPKENHFNRNYYSPTNGQRRSNNVYLNPHPSERTQRHYQRRHPFTNIDMEYSRMIPYGYGGRRHHANYMDMGECSRTPYGTMPHSTSRTNIDYATEIQYGSKHP